MILLVGAGYMAKEYAKVLKAMKLQFVAVGRSKNSSDAFMAEVGIKAESGGLGIWLKNNKAPNQAIVAVTEDQLGVTTKQLIVAGVKRILVEKPGGLNYTDISQVGSLAKRKKATVFVGYNRRFYQSVTMARQIINKDGGVTSFTFDFTERSHIIEKLPQSSEIKKYWFIQNSTHVIDLAFFLGGNPKKLNSNIAGRMPWHPAGAIFTGSGSTKNNIPFSYHANWMAPGCWSIEVNTLRHKLLFSPLEKLQIKKRNVTSFEDITLYDKIDTDFKPGLFKQVQSFLGTGRDLLTIAEQIQKLKYYSIICKE